MKRTLYFKNQPKIISASSIGGPKECEGKIGKYIDIQLKDDTLKQKSFEKAESKMMYFVINKCLKNVNLKEEDIDIVIAGDLLNQIISSSFAVRSINAGFLGVYNACATFTESLIIASTLIDGEYLDKIVCATSSHFSSAERQYRYPLELGSTRPPQSQWTVTGAGASLISKNGNAPKITMATIGRVVDFGVTDANNMGSAMAPSAVDTLCTHFKESGLFPSDYDLIVTGDLGVLGSKILKDLMWEKGFDIRDKHLDCGELIYDRNEKEYQGGSGAGCSSLVFNGYFYKKLIKKEFKRIILMSTGALLSSVSSMQGESIPAISHAVVIES